jgi:hypothetical protein
VEDLGRAVGRSLVIHADVAQLAVSDCGGQAGEVARLASLQYWLGVGVGRAYYSVVPISLTGTASSAAATRILSLVILMRPAARHVLAGPAAVR